MDGLTRKTFTTSRSLEYTYYDTAPTKPPAAEKPTILLLRGFPDNAQFWKQVIPTLTTTLPHRILAPDLLGYGGTSKPTSPTAFASDLMAADLAELLAHAQVTQAISRPAGHDWGSFLAQRLYLFHPSLCAGIALLNVAYAPPLPDGPPFDLAAANALLEQTTGRSPFAYRGLFTAHDAADVVERRLESFWSVLHGGREHWMRDVWCSRGVMREYLEAGKQDVPLRGYARPEGVWKGEWFEAMEAGGLESPLCWYKAYMGNVSLEAESALPRERLVVGVPVLFLGCSGDDVCLPAAIEPSKQAGLLPDLTVRVIDAPHWCAMAEPEEVAKALLEFFGARF